MELEVVVVAPVLVVPPELLPPQAASNEPTPTAPTAPFRKSEREMRLSASTGAPRGSGPELTVSSRLLLLAVPGALPQRPDERELFSLHAPPAPQAPGRADASIA